MRSEIIAVGTEVLLGEVVNTNAAVLSVELSKRGIPVYYHSVVGDNEKRLRKLIACSMTRSELVVLIGGLGPTSDDITKETVASELGIELVEDKSIFLKISSILAKFGRRIDEGSAKQAMIPKGAKVFFNPNGTADGLLVEHDKTKFLMLPGPPNEIQAIINNGLGDYLDSIGNGAIISREVKLTGISEREIEEILGNLMQSNDPTLAVYVKISEVRVRVTTHSIDSQEGLKKIENTINIIKSKLSGFIYGYDGDTLESVVMKALKARGLLLRIAESCTGGLLCDKFVSLPGSSEVLDEGVVCYSNSSKVNRLGIDKKHIEDYGAVSQEVSEAMAKGIVKGDVNVVGVSITGVAGPSGGSLHKPVGTVHSSVYLNGKVKSVQMSLSGDRDKIRAVAVMRALDLIRKVIN